MTFIKQDHSSTKKDPRLTFGVDFCGKFNQNMA
jgi:hypothetical protein